MAAAVIAIVGVVAAAASAYAAYSASEAQAQSMRYQQKVAKNQAQQAAQAAQIARENARAEHQRVLASQRARLGASGVISSEGSPLLVQMESAEQAALDEARITYAGQVQATGYRSQEILLGFEAQKTREIGAIGAGASLLGGVSSAGAGYYGRSSTTKPNPNSGG